MWVHSSSHAHGPKRLSQNHVRRGGCAVHDERWRATDDVKLQLDERLREGVFHLESWFDESVVAPARPAWIELADGGRVDVAVDVTRFGRVPDSHVVLADTSASRHHAEIQFTNGDYVLVDLGSTNGSRVNGSRVNRQALANGDRLTLGSINLVFRMS